MNETQKRKRTANFRSRNERAETEALLSPNPDLSDYVFGRVMPQALPLEEAVLGAIMLDRDAMDRVSQILRPESFYSDPHKLIYRAAIALFERNEPIDLLTVTEEMRRRGDLDKVDGGIYIVELANRVASAANIEYHARIVAQKFVQREIIRVGTDAIRTAYEDSTDAIEHLDNFEQAVMEIESGKSAKASTDIATLMARTAIDADAARSKKGVTGIPSGIRVLDELTGGFQDSDLIILAARPGMGKTSLGLTIARNAAKDYRVPVAFFSLEMSNAQLAQRIAASEAAINIADLRQGKVTDMDLQAISSAAESFSNVPLYIDETASLSIMQLRGKCRNLKKEHGIRLVIVDYLGLMEGDGDNREQVVSKISRRLKGIAKELNVPVIALSQLSRAVESRGGSKRPGLSDLRDSGGIEEAADMVCFIYRPEYYHIAEDESGNSTQDMAEIIIAKHRNGRTDTVKVGFTDFLAKFHNLGEKPFPQTEAPAWSPAMPASFSRPSLDDGNTPF